MKRVLYQSFTLLFPLLFAASGNAQSNLDKVLADITANNKTLQAEKQYWEAQKLQYRTGLSLPDPTIEFDYLFDTPADAGNQTDVTVSQSFDFPSVYGKKKSVSREQMARADIQLTAKRQELLLEAKKICIEIVYLQKRQSQIAQRKQQVEKLVSDYLVRLDKGNGNVMDVNKARLQLIEMNRTLQENVSDMALLQEKLTELNGSVPIAFTDSTYDLLPELLPFEQLEEEYEKNDPLRLILEQEMSIIDKQVELAKARWLPKMELGYHYQGLSGQNFHGLHSGISIPVWENKNTVKQKESERLYAELAAVEHQNEHYYEIKQWYGKYLSLKVALAQYEAAFSTLTNTALLNKALALGHITTIEYFMEMSYYNQAYDNYLETEKELYLVVADLYKYQL